MFVNPLSKKNDTPIVVVVDNGHWDAFSLNNQPTARDHFLMNLIRKVGGVNESVAPGTYLFNAQRKGPFLKQELTLTPYSGE